MTTLNPLFCSHMVLQANKPVRIFGSGSGEISVDFLGQTKHLCSTGNAWLLELDAHDYGGPYTMTVTLDGTGTVLDHIYLGDVYLLGGQSNMQMKLRECDEPAENYCTNENVRLFTVDRPEEGECLRTQNGWLPCTKQIAGEFPAIGYYVGSALASQTCRRIGLISCCQGASVIQTWMPPHLFDNNRFYVSDADKFVDHFNFPWNGYGHLYETMLSKVIPFPLKAVLWYQGEANSSPAEAEIYLELLRAFIGNVRTELQDPSLPFIVVQLADYAPWDGPGWRGIQKAQLQAQGAIPFVHTVISRDVSQTYSLHPQNKSKLSQRISDILLAL